MKRVQEIVQSMFRMLNSAIAGIYGLIDIIPGSFEPPVRTLRATIPENESHIFR